MKPRRTGTRAGGSAFCAAPGGAAGARVLKSWSMVKESHRVKSKVKSKEYRRLRVPNGNLTETPTGYHGSRERKSKRGAHRAKTRTPTATHAHMARFIPRALSIYSIHIQIDFPHTRHLLSPVLPCVRSAHMRVAPAPTTPKDRVSIPWAPVASARVLNAYCTPTPRGQGRVSPGRSYR